MAWTIAHPGEPGGPGTGPGPTSAGHRATVVETLARALAVYRLYPGQPDRPGFAAASERVARTVTDALVSGPVRIEIRHGCFRDPDECEDLTEIGRPLAVPLYEQGVELLEISRVPDGATLARLFDALDAGQLRERREDTTLHLAALRPRVRPRDDAWADAEAGQPASSCTTWELLGSRDELAARIVAASDGPPTGEDVLAWFRGLAAAVPSHLHDDPELVLRLRRVVAALPPETQHAYRRTAVQEARHQPLARRSVAAMTDGELVSALADIPDGALLAVRAIGEGERDPLLTTLLGWWHEAGGDPLEGGGSGPGVGGSGPEVDGSGPAVGGSGEEAGAGEAADRPASTAGDDPVVAVRSIARFLSLDPWLEAAHGALGRWKRLLTQAARTHDPRAVASVLTPVTAVTARMGAEVAAAVRATIDTAVDAATVGDLLAEDEDVDVLAEVLAPFGGGVVTTAFAQLTAEQRAARRNQLIRLVATLAPGHLERLEPWLDDERWFVARNVLTVLGRTGDDAALPLIARGMVHPDARVRAEAAQALRGVASPAAVEHLVTLVHDPEDPVRRAALTALAALTLPEAIAAIVAAAQDDRLARDAREAAVEALADHPQGWRELRRLVSEHGLPFLLRRHAGRELGRRQRSRW